MVETTVTAPEWESINDAATMAEALEKYGRVPLYGIHFLTGRADIAPESVIALRELAIMLDDNPDWNIRVEGHTDNVGTKAANSVLSLQRASAVAAYLAGRGIKRVRVTPMGMADAHPMAQNDTEAGRSKKSPDRNREVAGAVAEVTLGAARLTARIDERAVHRRAHVHKAYEP